MRENAKRRVEPAAPQNLAGNVAHAQQAVNDDVAAAIAELGPLGPGMAKLIRALLDEHEPAATVSATADVLDAAGVCIRYRVSAPTLRKWVAAGCPCMQYGEVRRFRISAVDAWLSASAKGGSSCPSP